MDDHFTQFIPTLEPIIKGIAYKKNKSIDTYAAISEAYIHMSRYIGLVKTTTQLEKIVVNWIKQNIGWTNSQLNKKEGVSQHDDLLHKKTYFSADFEDSNFITHYHTIEEADSSEEDLEWEIELEKMRNNKLAFLEMYRNYLREGKEFNIDFPDSKMSNKEKLNIFKCYWDDNIIKGVDLAFHLGVNKDYGARYLREMKADLLHFYKTKVQDNNK